MSTELRDLLAMGAAPSPTVESLDLERVLQRGRSIRARRRLASVAIVVGLVAGATSLTASLRTGEPPEIVGSVLTAAMAADLDAALAAAAAGQDLPGAAAAIVFADGTVWEGQSGNRGDLAASSVGPDTQFSLGHLTETVTAALIADLVATGEVTLDARADTWLRSLPSDATVGDLLFHTSGLPNVASEDGLRPAWFADPNRRWSADEVLAAGVTATGVTAAEAPGGEVRYADTDYIALGRIAELATGRSFGDLVRDRVLAPLGAEAVVVQGATSPAGPLAWPTGTSLDAPESFDLVPFPAWATGEMATNGMVATATQTARLLHDLFTSPTAAPWRSTMLDWRVSGDGRRPAEGAAGIVQGWHNGWREVWRADTGGTPGYRAATLHIPDAGVTVVIMANRGYEAEFERGFQGEGPGPLDAMADVILRATQADAQATSSGTDVWIADADGSNPRQLTDWVGQALPMDWSPDGRFVLVQSDRDGDFDLWLAPLDGSAPIQLSNETGFETFASFSPDGRQVVFTDNMAVDADLWIVNTDGSGMRRLVGEPGMHDWLPDWSPDGATIVFTRTERGDATSGQIWSVATDGSGAHAILTGGPGYLMPRWSPDGQSLALLGHGANVFTSRPDGSELREVLADSLVWHVGWSPDGSNLVLAIGGRLESDGVLGMTPDTPRDLWTLSLQGGDLQLLIGDRADDVLPMWSPDGTRLAFSRTTDG